MLEGKELEGKIGDVGSYSVDVDSSGNVAFELAATLKKDGFSLTSANKIEVHLFELLEKAAKANNVSWDDEALAIAKKLLGIA